MIKNIVGKSPLKSPFAFASSIDIFTQNGGILKIFDSTNTELGSFTFTQKILRDIRIGQNQLLEVITQDKADIILSILEENTALKGGCAVVRLGIECDGKSDVFVIPAEIKEKAEVMVFFNGTLVNDFEIVDNCVVFRKPPFKGCVLNVQLIKPQD